MGQTKAKKKRVVLLDAHAIIHRAYHALPDFTSRTGEPTGALYGLTTMLLKIVTDLKPDYVVACYDLPQKTFRHDAHDGYKGTRAKIDDALVTQLETSRNIFSAFSIPIYDAPGFEADDVLGTIVKQLQKEKGIEIIIASGDMDTLQLVSGTSVQVFTLKKGITDTVLYDEKSVQERFGFLPKYLPDYKGLRGDPSDNIIGIAGIGEKTASTLIASFGTIENLYATLRKNPEQVTALGISPRIQKLLEEGEDDALFSKELATIRTDAPITFHVPTQTFVEAVNIQTIEKVFEKLDFKSLGDRVRKTLGIQKSGGEKDEVGQPEKEGTVFHEEIPQELRIAYWLLDSETSNPTWEHLFALIKTKDPQEANDKVLALIGERGLSYVYKEIELPLIPIIARMQQHGILIDLAFLKKLADDYHSQLRMLEENIFTTVGHSFNINSPKQLGEVLFDEMQLIPEGGKKMKKTAGGSRSTRESELEKLRDSHPVVALVLQHREIQKLLSTYIDPLPGLVGPDGRLHATFTQTGTTTGRFSSQNPNLQNIPIKTELGKKVREAFIAAPGTTLVAFDYSQIELRIAALLSQDPYLMQVFQEGKDVHTAVAVKVFNVPEGEVTYEMRRRAKIINFGILYGMGVNALRENLGTDRKEAQAFYDNYFAQFPAIQSYLDGVIRFAEEHGYTETLFGRRRYFPGLRSKLPFIKAMAERMAINAPIQGTATADIIKIGMRQAEEILHQKKLDTHARLILQVHDELIYEIDNAYISECIPLITEAMEECIPKSFMENRKAVPLRVEVEQGSNWGNLA